MTYKEHSICIWCKHFVLRTKDSIIPSCSAFPKGVPNEIMPGERTATFDHRYPHPDDNGIQFEPNDDIDELMKLIGIREIVHRYGGDKDKIWHALNRLFAEYDDRREYGAMRPSLEEITNLENDVE